jgi:hypothetical protein
MHWINLLDTPPIQQQRGRLKLSLPAAEVSRCSWPTAETDVG